MHFLQREDLLQRVADGLSFLIVYTDADQQLRFANSEFQTWFGRSPEEVVGQRLKAVFNERLYNSIKDNLDAALARRQNSILIDLKPIGGPSRKVRVEVRPDLDALDRVRGLYLIFEDVTTQKRLEKSRKEQLIRLELINDLASFTNWETSLEELLERTVSKTGQRFPDLVGLSLTLDSQGCLITSESFEYSGTGSDRQPPDLSSLFIERSHLSPDSLVISDDVENDPRFKAQGETISGLGWRSLLLMPVYSVPGETGIFGLAASEAREWSYHEIETVRAIGRYLALSIQNISRFRKLSATEKKLALQVGKDGLTGLPNRNLFSERCAQALAQAARRSELLSVLWLDLDEFKDINDLYGHPAGDQLLRDFSSRLRGAVRTSDIVGRMGGDEFAVLATETSRPEDSGVIAEKILSVLRQPFLIESEPRQLSVSVGISIYPYDGRDVETLIKAADLAMYQAKRNRKGTYQHYSQEIGDQVKERLELRRSLEEAWKQGEFVLHFQPIVDSQTYLVCAVEALLRWERPEFGLVYPDEFIPTLEETGLISKVFKWELKKVAAQAEAWERQGRLNWKIAVDLGDRLLAKTDAVLAVKQTLSDTALHPSQLILESSELALMEIGEAAVGFLEELSEMGTSVVINDFGTGYSSIEQLRRLPISAVKIPHKIVSRLPQDRDAVLITQTILSLAKSLGIKVIGAGVESKFQLDFLTMEKCDQLQGHFIRGPVPAASLVTVVEQINRRRAN